MCSWIARQPYINADTWGFAVKVTEFNPEDEEEVKKRNVYNVNQILIAVTIDYFNMQEAAALEKKAAAQEQQQTQQEPTPSSSTTTTTTTTSEPQPSSSDDNGDGDGGKKDKAKVEDLEPPADIDDATVRVSMDGNVL